MLSRPKAIRAHRNWESGKGDSADDGDGGSNAACYRSGAVPEYGLQEKATEAVGNPASNPPPGVGVAVWPTDKCRASFKR